jgi:hypothetical protein
VPAAACASATNPGRPISRASCDETTVRARTIETKRRVQKNNAQRFTASVSRAPSPIRIIAGEGESKRVTQNQEE